MSSAVARPRSWRLIPAFLLSLALALGGVVAGTSAPARAAEGDIAGATLQWGVKESFRNYLTSPIAHGEVNVSGGVAASPAYTWSSGTGSVASGAVAYPGMLHFSGHGGELDVKISDVRVTKTSDGGAIVADILSKKNGSPEVVNYPDVTFVTFSVTSWEPDADGNVVVTNAPAVLTAEGAPAFADFYKPSEAMDPVSFTWPVEEAPEAPGDGETPGDGEAPVDDEAPGDGETPAPVTPEVEVSKATDLKEGEVITVRGSGFGDPSVRGTRPPLAGKFGGAYVVIGSFPDVWEPSKNISSKERTVHVQKWVVDELDLASIGGANAGGIAINPDGSFEIEFTVEKPVDATEGTNFGIYTYPGSGATSEAFETYTPLTFAPEAAEPALTVSKTSDLDPDGENITVQASGFNTEAAAAFYYGEPSLKAGYYLQIGWVADDWRPSNGAPAASRANAYTQWVSNMAPPASMLWDDPVTGAAMWTVEITKAELDAVRIDGGTLAVFAVGAGGYKGVDSEAIVPISFAGDSTETPEEPGAPGEQPNPGPTPQPNPGPAPQPNPGVETPAVASGSLVWGVKASFRNYVANVAKGQVIVSGASSSGGAFVFGQRGVSSFDTERGTGTVSYNGSVRFTGHGGALDLTFANPSITVISGSSAHLYATVGGARVHLANLNLGAASKSVSNGATTFRNAPATLTAAGASAFNGFYGAGESLDSVTFTVGAAATSTPGTATVAGVSTAATANNGTPAPTPPATSGVTIEGVEEGDVLQAGSEITITADGFQPNEQDILVVIYSEPTVLDRNATADANGRVTWTGTLPADLTGEHTLTLQGSVTRGVVVTIDELMRTMSIGQCEATDAQLTWGFKEAFRAYLTSTIANGEWTVADGATYEVPNFGWEGDGNYDTDSATGSVTMTGSVNFTGHGGVLNTTIANPRIEFIDENSAELFLDVIGETQDGETVNDAGVLFATIDLTGTVDETDGTVTVADAPATLTEDGSAAFGTYEPNTELDPITLTFSVDPECGTAAGEAPVEDETEEAEVTPISDGNDLSWLPWLIVGVVLLAAIVVIVMLARRKKE